MSKLSNLTAFIFARGGSKAIPHKNISMVARKPLIAHSIISALASKSVSKIIVSTDDADIAAAAKQYGADVLERPSELAQDATPEVLAWRHAIDSFPQLFTGDNPQPFISLPATSPLRSPEDIDAAVTKFSNGNCDIVFGITPSHRNPYLNMVTISDENLIKIAIPGSSAVRRQDVPDMFDITTSVYVANPNYVMECTKLIDGRVGYVEIPAERALDVDNAFDLHLADLLLTHPYKSSKG